MNGSAGIAIIGRAPVARPAGTWRQLAASADGGLAWKTQRLTEDRPSGSFCWGDRNSCPVAPIDGAGSAEPLAANPSLFHPIQLTVHNNNKQKKSNQIKWTGADQIEIYLLIESINKWNKRSPVASFLQSVKCQPWRIRLPRSTIWLWFISYGNTHTHPHTDTHTHTHTHIHTHAHTRRFFPEFESNSSYWHLFVTRSLIAPTIPQIPPPSHPPSSL